MILNVLLMRSRAESVSLPASFVESIMVLSKFASAKTDIDTFVDRHEIGVAPIDRQVAQLAAEAFLRYGKGQGHKAQLNLGDCFSYAVAKHFGAPLLFRGEDFVHTDVRSALSA